MIARHVTMLLAAAGVMLVASQAQAESKLSFINKYIEKYAKVKPGDKIAGFDLNSLTSQGSGTGGISNRLSSLRNRIGK